DMEKLRTIGVDKYPLPQMQEQVDTYIGMKANLIQAGGVRPDQGLIDQDEDRQAKGVIPDMDTNRGRIPPLSPKYKSDIEKFAGDPREAVSDTVKYRKDINEAQGRISDQYSFKAQESIQKGE